jgi:hypothetical protein
MILEAQQKALGAPEEEIVVSVVDLQIQVVLVVPKQEGEHFLPEKKLSSQPGREEVAEDLKEVLFDPAQGVKRIWAAVEAALILVLQILAVLTPELVGGQIAVAHG